MTREALVFLAFNELMVFVTIIVAFPGWLPPQDRTEWFMIVLLFIPMSFVWWIFLALFPFVYLFLWLIGDLKDDDFFHDWPFRCRRP